MTEDGENDALRMDYPVKPDNDRERECQIMTVGKSSRVMTVRKLNRMMTERQNRRIMTEAGG